MGLAISKRIDNRRRVHAMSVTFAVFCKSPGADKTSLVIGPNDSNFWSIVTCKKCMAMRNDRSRYR
jgi:hypothetical protein